MMQTGLSALSLPSLLPTLSHALATSPTLYRRGGPERFTRSLLRGLIFTLVLTTGFPLVAQAAVIPVTGGCTLVDAITAANNNAATGGCPSGAGADILNLNSDVILTTVNNNANGSNGLPSIVSDVTINGNGHTIERDSALTCSPPVDPNHDFRIFHVASSGTLTLNEVTVRNGGCTQGGAGIFNGGTVNLNDSTIAENTNFAGFGGGILNVGTLHLTNSVLFKNSAFGQGGGLSNVGLAILTNCTITQNSAGVGGGISNGDAIGSEEGTLQITNCTIAQNTTGFAGGILSGGGPVSLTNTILDNLSSTTPDNCERPGSAAPTPTDITSLGHNLATDNTCQLTQTSDQQNVSNLGLGVFSDDGTPGAGHFPLLVVSPAIDQGDDGACLSTDQLGEARVDIPGIGTSICDIGAVEFQGQDHIDELCPCAGPLSGGTWKNHGGYVSCVAQTAGAFVQQGLLTGAEKGAIVSAAARSKCGK